MIHAIFNDKNLSLYFTGRFISSVGNYFSFFAQSIAAYLLSHSLTAVGLLWFVRGISSLIMIPIGGVMADTYSRRKIIIFSDIISAFISFSYIFVTPHTFIWLFPILVFTSQAINRFFDPAAKAAFKQVSAQTPLELSGSFSAILGHIAVILGPLLASLVYLLLNSSLTILFMIDGFSFLISFSFMMFVSFGDEKTNSRGSFLTFYRNMSSGFQHITKERALLTLILLLVPISLAGKVFEVLVLNLSEKKWSFGSVGGIGVYLAIFSLGGIISSFFIEKWSKKLTSLKWYINLTVGCGLLFILLGLSHILFINFGVTFLLGGFTTMSVVMAQISIQKTANEDYLGRIFSAWTFIAVIGGAIGATCSGYLNDTIGNKATLMLTGIVLVIPWTIHFIHSIFKRNQHYNKHHAS